MKPDSDLHVAIIGAGAAGLFAAQKLASAGYGVALFNRDIKPGGLVEYGIFLEKHKLKNGFRTQFQQILDLENVHYFGNITIGKNGQFGIQDLLNWGFQAVLVSCGAQGTKLINLPGERIQGVYHAKDLVYHYNQLPPFSTREFPIGKKVAIIGAGNVMTDIAHYLINYREVEEITVIIRRGPTEVKFDQKELLPIIGYLDLDDFHKEVDRVAPIMRSIGQDPDAAEHRILIALEKACPKEHPTKILIRFLQSPREIIANPQGSVAAVMLEHNSLVLADEQVKAQGMGELSKLEVDNVIFAIGDKVNDDLDLPIIDGQICKAEYAKYPIEGITFEVGVPSTGEPLPGVFHAGWARNPSTGLAGIARRDGVFAADAIMKFLSTETKPNTISLDSLVKQLNKFSKHYVTKQALVKLTLEEHTQATARGLEEFKFSTNQEMLAVMGLSYD